MTMLPDRDDVEDPDGKTQIRVSKLQRAQIHSLKNPGETYEEAVSRLLDVWENRQQDD